MMQISSTMESGWLVLLSIMLVFLTADITVVSGARRMSDEEKLLKELFTDYNPSARPVINSSSSVTVQIQFSLMHIKELDIRSQVFTTTGLLILDWTDERLQWNSIQHNNLTEIIVEAKGLWRPEFAVINGAEHIYENYDGFRAVISSEGRVHWEPGGVFKTMCEIDITYYPFDEQRCELMFGAWSYHTAKMNLTNDSLFVNLDSYKTNGEWHVYRTKVDRKEFAYECCPNEKFSNVAFIVFLRRRHTFYVMNVILPSIMTSILLLSVFFCTPGQKVQIGVVVLLSFRIFLLNVSGNIPKTSDHIPLLGIYLTCIMAITTLSMVLTVFVLNLHHVTDKPVPPLAKKIVFLYVAPLLGMCSLADAVGLSRSSKMSQSRSSRRGRHNAVAMTANFMTINRRQSSMVADLPEEREAMVDLTRVRTPTLPPVNDHHHIHHHIHNSENNSGMQTTELINNSSPPKVEPPTLPTREFTFSPAVTSETPKPQDYSKDWKQMAEVFDRLFFWVFFLAILISTLVLFHPLTKAFLGSDSAHDESNGQPNLPM